MTESPGTDRIAPVLGWLRAEGAAAGCLSIALYSRLEAGWIFFLLLILTPDLSLLGYLAGKRTGTACYNLVHSYLLPLLLAATSIVLDNQILLAIALIWTAHVGIDRTLGYGLKLPAGFAETHLGTIGRKR